MPDAGAEEMRTLLRQDFEDGLDTWGGSGVLELHTGLALNNVQDVVDSIRVFTDGGTSPVMGIDDIRIAVSVVDDSDTYPDPILGLDIFNNGPGGAASRPNPGLAQAGTIRVWTQFDGVIHRFQLTRPSPQSTKTAMTLWILFA